MTRRRSFLTLLGGAAAAWPVGAWAQQGDRMRLVGVLHAQAADEPQSRARLAAFRQALQKLGWAEGRNLRIEERWSAGNSAETPKFAAELVNLAPDVILTSGAGVVARVMHATVSIPVVFVLVADPVGAGFVNSLARPGGNVTGFAAQEDGLGGKWIELLKEIAPGTTRAAVLRDPTISAGIGVFGAIQSAAPSAGIKVSPVTVEDAVEMERALTAFASDPDGGLVVTPSAGAFVHRDLIIALAARHKLPAVHAVPSFVRAGALAGYGPDILDQYGRAAFYVDRILKGEKPANLPVQTPTKYELVINLRTARALGLTVPATLLARADEVIE